MIDLIYLAGGVALFLVLGLYAVGLREGLTMLVAILWGVGAVGVGVYMLVALLRPERF